MGYVIPPGFSRVTVEYAAVSGLGSAPVWGFGCSAPPDSDLLTAMAIWVADELIPATGTSWTVNKVVARNDTTVLEAPGAITGTRGGSECPPQVAALVKQISGVPGRSNRGRFYWPGVLNTADVFDVGQISESRQNALGALAITLQEAIESLDAHFVILHSNSSDPTAVLSTSVQGYVATQRRRMRA